VLISFVNMLSGSSFGTIPLGNIPGAMAFTLIP
jgi:hypothetical protein